MSKVTVIVGGQYGSEAKGKVVQYLANEYDLAVRGGSPNAGHTVIDSKKVYKLRQIPAAFLNKKCKLCIAAGALIDKKVLDQEVENTRVKNRLFIDKNIGIIEQKHKKQEKELVRNISSTGKGCGAAQIDRIWRKDFKLAKNELKKYQIVDVSEMINKYIDEDKNILIEGTQGFGLSILHGNYPYVTSRDTTAAGLISEVGISPLKVTEIILVIRTYPIRVAGNSGPLKNEISWQELSDKIGKKVIEKTTVTNKIRRVAEFDIELVKKAIKINRPTQIALQFLNYLFPEDYNKDNWQDLSLEAKKYILKLEKELGTKITLIGTSEFKNGMIDRRYVLKK